MAVNFTSGPPLSPLTSRPEKPDPAPKPEWIAKTVDCGDRDILVTVPFPDSLELIAPIRNEHQVSPDLSGKSINLVNKELDQNLKASLIDASLGAPKDIKHHVNTAQTKAVWMIPYDTANPHHRARATLWRKERADLGYGVWTLKIEVSASKAGPAGLVKLVAALVELLWFFDLEALFPSLEVARVDAAIDCIGAYPLDLIAHIPKAGKRMVFLGNHGRPESVYLYEAKALPQEPPKSSSFKTKGPHRLTLYERRDYHLQFGLQPPYGDCPVTRAEVPYRWTKVRPMLADLASIPNLWSGKRVAYAATAAPGLNSKDWRKFCLAAFGAGRQSSFIGWLPGPGGKFAETYASVAGNMADDSSWSEWERGLKLTGLEVWIKMASMKT